MPIYHKCNISFQWIKFGFVYIIQELIVLKGNFWSSPLPHQIKCQPYTASGPCILKSLLQPSTFNLETLHEGRIFPKMGEFLKWKLFSGGYTHTELTRHIPSMTVSRSNSPKLRSAVVWRQTIWMSSRTRHIPWEAAKLCNLQLL